MANGSNDGHTVTYIDFSSPEHKFFENLSYGREVVAMMRRLVHYCAYNCLLQGWEMGSLLGAQIRAGGTVLLVACGMLWDAKHDVVIASVGILIH